MFYSRNQQLFSECSLGDYLRQTIFSLEKEIKDLSLEQINGVDEKDLLDQLVMKYQISAPILDEGKIDINAQEATVSVNRQFGFDDGPVDVPGLSITVRIPFSGFGDLFRCRASTHSMSGTPCAEIEGGHLVLYYETIEKDAEKIKGLWKSDIGSIKQNLGWVEKDTISHNDSLENIIKAGLMRREKEAEENESLINKLKG